MRNGLVLFTSDRGITPAARGGRRERGFRHRSTSPSTHTSRSGAPPHPAPATRRCPGRPYLRTLDPWVSLATVAAVTSRIRLSAVALPVESGRSRSRSRSRRWTTSPAAASRSGRLRLEHRRARRPRSRPAGGAPCCEYVEAMRALWTQGGGVVHDGEFVRSDRLGHPSPRPTSSSARAAGRRPSRGSRRTPTAG